MANYSSLISAMEAVIRQNGNQQITGTILQTVLRSVILELGAEFQFGGVATPDTDPNNPDYNVAYIAGAGTYTNFDNQTIPTGKIGIFKNRGAESGTWALQTFDISLGANSVSESNIQNGAVTESKIADNSVSTDKIKNKNVTRNKLSDRLIDELDNKANINGFYSTLGAGVAQNLVGKGNVPAEYTFRTAGGSADIGSGAALIKKLKGRTLVWNQLVPIPASDVSASNNGVTLTDNRDGSYTLNGTASATTYFDVTGNLIPSVSNKYFAHVGAKTNGLVVNFTDLTTGGFDYVKDTAIGIGTWTVASFIVQIRVAQGTVLNNEKIYPFLTDLTLMFGAGNEPSTVEEFEALFPLDYYAYNEGELLSVKATGIKTVGFNQWDEVCSISGITLTSTNYIPCFPATQYYLKAPNNNFTFNFYDAEKNLITTDTSINSNAVFTTPANCYYMKFIDTYGTTYKNDICINLSWSGYRNGEYEPYWESELPIPITTMTGKLNGEGESVVIFPDGACGAGTAFDEITSDKAVKRIGKVNLGNLDWLYSSTPYSLGASIGPNFYATINGAKNDNEHSIAITAKYVGVSAAYAYTHDVDKIVIIEDGSNVKIKDSAYTDTAAFKAAMNGIYLYYELATPEKYTLDNPLALNYKVDDFGTEMELPQNDDEPVTAPIRYEVQYAMNAVDTLRRLPQNYISKESFEDFLAEFDSKLGAALNATIVSTMTFNAETQKYGFTITITPNNP